MEGSSTVHRLGEVIDGRYELRRLLAAGVASSVFEVQHTFTEQRLAMKIASVLGDPGEAAEERRRVLQEAKTLGRLRHPGIVAIFDAGVASGSPFIVHELLDGRSLESLVVSRGRLEPQDAVALVTQACQAVEFAHRCRVVHCALRMSSILLVHDPVVGERVKVVDFGDSRPMAAGDDDSRIDGGALGAVLYECLTGKAASEATMGQVPRPVLPNVTPALTRVVQRAMAKDPAQRQASVAQLAEELRLACPEASTHRTALLESKDDGRRRFPRAPYNTPARLVTSRGAVDGLSQDVSEGGMLFQTFESCNVGDQVVVRFGLPMDGKIADCPARVTWVRGDGQLGRARLVGLAFLDAPSEVRSSIGRYVALMATKEA